jgi:hypothetical protein
MWRAYSPDKNRVKVRSTVNRLHDSLMGSWNEFRDISCFVGKVRYLERPHFRKALESRFRLDNTNIAQVQTLLLKRYGFRSESEVRIVVDNGSHAPEFVRYAVDPNTLIDEAVLDPRMDSVAVENAKASFRAAGLMKPVFQSGLYKKPGKIVVQLD